MIYSIKQKTVQEALSQLIKLHPVLNEIVKLSIIPLPKLINANIKILEEIHDSKCSLKWNATDWQKHKAIGLDKYLPELEEYWSFLIKYEIDTDNVVKATHRNNVLIGIEPWYHLAEELSPKCWGQYIKKMSKTSLYFHPDFIKILIQLGQELVPSDSVSVISRYDWINNLWSLNIYLDNPELIQWGIIEELENTDLFPLLNIPSFGHYKSTKVTRNLLRTYIYTKLGLEWLISDKQGLEGLISE